MLRWLTNIIKAFFLGLYYYAKEAIEYIRVICLYYRHPRFAFSDILLQISYLLTNTGYLCTRFVARLPATDVQYVYGETPLTTFETIYRTIQPQAGNTLYELGCGRGRLAFFASTVLQIPTVAIDINPTFIARAQRIARWTHNDNINFQCVNFIDCDLGDADIVYLYGSAFSEEAWPNLLVALSTTKIGATIITTSWPLTDLSDDGRFVVQQRINGNYLWGEADVYIHSRA